MTFSDYRAFGELPTTVKSTGALAATDNNSSNGHMFLVCLADASLTSVVFKYPVASPAPDAAISLKAGAQLMGVKSCVIASGQVQAFYIS